jgi:phosphoglycolate phosphatase
MLDHDGVVADSFDVLSMAIIEACRRVGLEGVKTADDVLALFEGNVFERLRAGGADDVAIREIERRSALTIRNALPWVKPFPLMPQLLDELGGSHHVAIVTTGEEDVVWAFLRRHKVTGVEEVVGAAAGESKAEKMAALIGRHRGSQETYWFVGDTAGDMREARLAGATPCGVAWGWHDPELLRAAGAAAIAETPPDVLEIVAPLLAEDFWD